VRYPLADWCLAYAYAVSGTADARPLLEQIARVPISEQGLFYSPLWVSWIAAAHLVAGRLADTGTLASRAVEFARRRGERGHHAWALQILGDVAVRRGDIDEAENDYLAALGIAATLGMRPLRARCYLALARLYRRADKPLAADEYLLAARVLAGELGLRLAFTDDERER
jgi:hypothetical protein